MPRSQCVFAHDCSVGIDFENLIDQEHMTRGLLAPSESTAACVVLKAIGREEIIGSSTKIAASLSDHRWIDPVVQRVFSEVSRSIMSPHRLEEVRLEFIEFRLGKRSIKTR